MAADLLRVSWRHLVIKKSLAEAAFNHARDTGNQISKSAIHRIVGFFVYVVYGCRNSRDGKDNSSAPSSYSDQQKKPPQIRLGNGEAKKISKSAIEIESEIVFKKRMAEYSKRKADWPSKERELKLVESELSRLSDQIEVLKSESKKDTASQKRFWRSKDGRFTTEATLVGIGNDEVSLEKVDGEMVQVKMEKLSTSDIEYIQTNFKLDTKKVAKPEDNLEQAKQLRDRLNELLEKHGSIIQSKPIEPTLSKVREELEHRKSNTLSEASSWAELRTQVIEDASKPKPPSQPAAQSPSTRNADNPRFRLFLSDLVRSNEGFYVEDVKINREIKKTVDVYVGDHWHYLPYQIRYQMAQNIWKKWAISLGLSDIDDARIKFKDLNGNVVGGSSVFAGSIVWVSR